MVVGDLWSMTHIPLIPHNILFICLALFGCVVTLAPRPGVYTGHVRRPAPGPQIGNRVAVALPCR